MKDKMMALEEQNSQKINQLESKIHKIETKSVRSSDGSFREDMGSKELTLEKQMLENVSAIAPVKERFDESAQLLIKTDDDPKMSRSPEKNGPFNYQLPDETETLEQIPSLGRPQLSPVKEYRSPIKTIPIDDLVMDTDDRPETHELSDFSLDLPKNNLQNTHDNVLPGQADTIPLEFSSQGSFVDLEDVTQPKFDQETPFPYGGETTMSDNLGLTVLEDNDRNDLPALKEKAERAMIQHLNKQQESGKKSRSSLQKSHASAASKFVRDTPLIKTPQLSVNNSNFTNQIDPDEIIVEEVNDVYDEFGILLEEQVVSVEKQD